MSTLPSLQVGRRKASLAAAFLARCVDAFVRASGADLPPFPGERRYASLHDAWIAALTSPDPAVRWDDAGEIAAFTRSLGLLLLVPL